MRHLPVWFVTEPPGGPRSNPASYYRAGTRTRTVPRQKLGALSVELGGYRKRTEDRRQTTDDRRQTTQESFVLCLPSSVLRMELRAGLEPASTRFAGAAVAVPVTATELDRGEKDRRELDPGAGLEPASRRSERRIL